MGEFGFSETPKCAEGHIYDTAENGISKTTKMEKIHLITVLGGTCIFDIMQIFRALKLSVIKMNIAKINKSRESGGLKSQNARTIRSERCGNEADPKEDNEDRKRDGPADEIYERSERITKANGRVRPAAIPLFSRRTCYNRGAK